MDLLTMKQVVRFHACLFLAFLTLPITSLLAVDHYVSPAGGNVSAYTNWAKAATNIQAALNVAVDGETVWVTNGMYAFPATIIVSNAVTLKSAHGYNVTTLNGRNAIRGLIISNANAVVDGFMISNCALLSGTTWDNGGAVLICDGGGGTLRNCFVCNSRLTPGFALGGGVCISATNGLVESCIISNNYAIKRGGGVGLFVTGGILRNSLIINNSNDFQGAGIYIYGIGRVDNCTVVGNAAMGTGTGGGINIEATATGTGIVCNSISYLNTSAGDTSSNITGIGASSLVSNNCFGTASALPAGNIKVDPQFINPALGDYHLSSTSQCVNAGMNQAWMTDAVDLDRRSRLDKFSRQVDMGCYEYIFKGSMVEVR